MDGQKEDGGKVDGQKADGGKVEGKVQGQSVRLRTDERTTAREHEGGQVRAIKVMGLVCVRSCVVYVCVCVCVCVYVENMLRTAVLPAPP